MVSVSSEETNRFYHIFGFCSYVNYSNIAAKLLRKVLKPELRADAAKRGASNVRITPWSEGKAQSK